MIAAGTVITFRVQGSTGEYIPRSIEGVRSGVVDGLTPFFDVASVEISASTFLSDPLHSLSFWPYDATVRATVRSDYGNIRDVDSIVASAFYNAAGNLPTVTAEGLEQGQGESSTQVGVSTSLGIGVVVVLVALSLLVFLKLEL